jgi:C4-dicarboxylate-binding protein DctP
MKKFRVMSMVLVLLMLVLSVTGCASESKPNTPSATTNTDAPNSNSEYNGPEVKMKVAFGASIEGKLGVSATHFKENVEKRTGGKVEVQIYPSSQLGSEREIAEGVSLGTVEVALTGMGTFATFYDKLQFANTPFLFDSREHSYNFYDGELMKQLNVEILDATGIKVMCYSENGLRTITNKTREIKKPEDLKGIKVRVQENPLHISMIQTLGGTATPINFSELYTALSQGTVDGQDNPISLTVEQGFYEVQKYMTTTFHTYDQIVFAASNDWFNSLDPSLQKILEEESILWQDDLRQLSIQFDEDGKEIMKEAGVTITELTPEERQAFKDQMKPAYDKARELVGNEFMEEVLAAIEEARP